jgi:hypothetical protein
MNAKRFTAYIDESGDEGSKFEEGSSRWFVLSAMVVENTEQIQQMLCQLIDSVRDTINQGRQEHHRIPPCKPLHFRDLKHDDRKFFSMKIGQVVDVCSISVLCHKPTLQSLKQERLYHYLLRVLVERISLYCRNRVGSGSSLPRLKLTLSNRGGLRQSAVDEYFRHLWHNLKTQEVVVDGNAVLDKILVLSSGKAIGLQLADAIASSIFYSVEPNRYGMVETAYLQLIMPRVYSQDGFVLGHGIKVFPKEAVSELPNETRQIIAGPGL